MGPFELIIFDCDGVLVDSERIAAQVVSRLKTELGVPTTLEDQLRRFVGLGPSSPAVIEERKRLPAEYPELVLARILEAFAAELQPMPGVRDLLEKLALPACVASSSSPKRLHFSLERTELKPFFGDAVYSGSQVKNGKPAPDLFLFAAERMGIHPSKCLVIEDSEPGVQGAIAAGMTCLGFVGGSHADASLAERLKGRGATEVFAEFREVLDWIEAKR